jgi:hypothetical protein
VERGEKERGEVRFNSVGVLAFYRGPGECQGGVAGEFNADVNGFNAIEDGGGFKRGFKGGEKMARR